MTETTPPDRGRTDPYEALAHRVQQFHQLPGHRQMRLRLWFSGPDSKYPYLRRRHATTFRAALLGIAAGLVNLAELLWLFTNFWVRLASWTVMVGCLLYVYGVHAQDEDEVERGLLAAHYDDVRNGRVDNGRSDWPGPLA
ncbi:hypothetical protein M8C13_06350 [Crossiella sp. SN42]|uniref:hypothetical protein n=1 Tax=Crossiella sp. SN42 TaxID=2944808 RepID=UPI00207C6A71|nr:hypothetical protein [Crossiella sp. SN42]MCO1575381.1 hypothetical protein [Crossiella sp. SN42]